MKNHKQFCGLAVALDYVGDRWTLLIVRELLIAPRKFSQLQGCLPGCAPNLLASRLREMKKNHIVEHITDPSTKQDVYRLTELGLGLRSSIENLIVWGGTILPSQKGLAEQRPHWLELAIPALLRPRLKNSSEFKIQFHVDDHVFAVIARNHDLDVIKGLTEKPDCTLNVTYRKLLALMSGFISPNTLGVKEIGSSRFANKAEIVEWLSCILAKGCGYGSNKPQE